MELLLGYNRIICKGVNKVPTLREMVKADSRIIYVGHIEGNPFEGEHFNLYDAFLFTADWNTLHTIEHSYLKDNVAYISTKSHGVCGWNTTMMTLMERYHHELYVGNVVNVSPGCGKVYYDTYSDYLGDEERHFKRNGKNVRINKDGSVLCNYADLAKWRLVAQNSKGTITHFAFFSIEEAVAKWIQIHKRYKVQHNIPVSKVRELDNSYILEDFNSLSDKEHKKFEDSFSTEGFLYTFWD